jgi:enoyl-CoA hydratase
MESETSHISVESGAGVMWIRLCRPQAMNALSSAMLDVMSEAIDLAGRNEDVRCVVIIGEGKAFCAGADLSAVPEGSDALAAFIAKASATMRRIELLEKPVIACLNGLTLAGGLELVLCADIVVAAMSAQIGDGHVKLGFLPGAGGSVRLARAIGPGRARFLLYSGQRLSATDMERWGLVQQVFEDSEFRDQVALLAARIAEYSPLVLRRLKALVASSLGGEITSLLAEELAANVAHAGSHDMREGLAAFAQKRKPVFLGR